MIGIVKMTYAGHDLVVPSPAVEAIVEKLCDLPQPLNHFASHATASQYGEGFFLVTRDTMREIIKNVSIPEDSDPGDNPGRADLVFQVIHGTTSETVTLKHISVGPRTRIVQTGKDQTLYLLHLVDQKYVALRLYHVGGGLANGEFYNITMPNGTEFYDDSLNGVVQWTFQTLLNDLYQTYFTANGWQSITSSLDVPIGTNVNPRDLAFVYTPAPIAMDTVLRLNGWTFIYHPYTTEVILEDFLSPTTTIQAALSQLAGHYLSGGLVHPEYNYKNLNWFQGTGDNNEPDQFLGSDLFSLPINTHSLFRSRYIVLFPTRFTRGRYPALQDNSVATQQVWSVVVNGLATPANIDPDFQDAIEQRDHGGGELVHYDHHPAIIDDVSGLLQNGTELNNRAQFLAERVAKSHILPYGRLVYDGFHPVVPSSEIHTVVHGVEHGIPVTKLIFDGTKPKMLFNHDAFEGNQAAAMVSGLGLAQVQYRPDGGYNLSVHAPLVKFFDEPSESEACDG